MKKLKLSVAATAILAGALLLPAGTANAADFGGWSEDGVSSSTPTRSGSVSIMSTPKHTGKSEQKSIGGTTNKRAHGWTTWTGVYHYTTAQMERSGGGTVYNTSGRQWGTSGTEAISPWRAFNPNYDLGSARTYYGK